MKGEGVPWYEPLAGFAAEPGIWRIRAKKYERQVRDLNYTGSENVHHAKTPEAAAKAQEEWDRTLVALAIQPRQTVTGWITEAEKPHIAGKGTIFQQNDHPHPSERPGCLWRRI